MLLATHGQTVELESVEIVGPGRKHSPCVFHRNVLGASDVKRQITRPTAVVHPIGAHTP